jgi:hypothetical protein
MKTTGETSARLTKELLEMAKDMRASGIMSDADYERILRRHGETKTARQPSSGDDN